MSLLATTFKITWLLICIAGNLYQVQQISDDFFEYQIVTTISVKFPDKFQVPAISFCAFEAEIVNWDKLEAIKPDVKQKLNATSLSDEELIRKIHLMSFFAKNDFQGIMFEGLDMKTRASLLYQFHELFGICSIVGKDGATIKFGNCSDFFDIRTFHLTYFVCHAFNFKTDEFLIDYLDSNRAEIIPGFLYLFYLTQKAIKISSQALIMYNENHYYNRVGFYRSLFISQLDDLISLQYDEYTNVLLEAPYVTHCLKYKEADFSVSLEDEKITDRGSCFEACLRNKSDHILGPDTSFPGIFIFEKAIEKQPKQDAMTVYELYRNASLVEVKNNLSRQCNLICASPKCDETLFVPSIRSSIEYPIPAIVTYTMQSPKIETTCNAKLSFIVFLTNVFSTFGFWIGLSLFSIVDIFTDFAMTSMKWFKKQKIQKMHSKRNDQKNNQANCHDKSQGTICTSSHEKLSLNLSEYSHVMSHRQMRTTRRDRSRTQQTYDDRWRNIENNSGRDQLLSTQLRCRRCKMISDEYDKHLTHLNARKIYNSLRNE